MPEQCVFCRAELIPPYPSDKAVERFKVQSGRDFFGKVCNRCINIYRDETRSAQRNSIWTLAYARNRAREAIKKGDYESFKKAEFALTNRIERARLKFCQLMEADAEIEILLKRLETVKNEVLEEMAKSPSASYFVRRKQADAFISKPEVRLEVFTLHGRRCKRCGSTEHISIDHIISVKNGGSDDLVNLQPLCRSCNSSKGASNVIC